MNRMLAAFAAAFMLIDPAVAAPEWIKVTSANFDLYTAAGEREARDTLVLFEQVRDFFMRVKSQTVTTRLPVTIVGFRNEKDYKPYSPNGAAAAYYSGDEQRDYIVMGSLAGERTPEAIHEYMHLLVRHSGLTLPIWLNEGFAEVYSTLKPMGGQIVLGTIPTGRAIVLGRAKWLPLSKLISITRESPEYNEKDRAGVFYAQSWLLAHMLMLHKDYRDGFPKFTGYLSTTKDAEKAFDVAYHKKLWEIELDLNSYYHANTIGGIAFKTRFEKIQIDPAKPATDLELGITLAKLKTLVGRYDEAASRLSELAKTHPGNVEIEEALAYLYWREHKREEALQHFSRAVALGAASWKTYWDYARLAGPDSDKTVYVDALRKTVELKPDLLDARLALGSELVRQRSWAQGLVVLRPVKNIEADQATDYFLLMAYCAMNLNFNDEARTYATNARKYAKEPERQNQADQIIAFLDRRSGPPSHVSEHDSPSARPTLAQTPAPETPSSQPERLNVKGNFKRLDCLGTAWRMHVTDGHDTLLLLLREVPPGQTLKCGPQNAAVSVDYLPKKDDNSGTVGEVRHIEFIE